MHNYIFNANGLKAIKKFASLEAAAKYLAEIETSLNSSLAYNVVRNLTENEGFTGSLNGSRKYEVICMPEMFDLTAQFYCESYPFAEPIKLYCNSKDFSEMVENYKETVKRDLIEAKRKSSSTVQNKSFWATISFRFGKTRSEEIELAQIEI